MKKIFPPLRMKPHHFLKKIAAFKVIKTTTFYILKLVTTDCLTMDFFMKLILLQKYNQIQVTLPKFTKRGEVIVGSDMTGSSQ